MAFRWLRFHMDIYFVPLLLFVSKNKRKRQVDFRLLGDTVTFVPRKPRPII